MQNKNHGDATARKFPNKSELMSADLINVRDDLTFDIDSIFEITEYSQCPVVSRCQNEKIFNSLINTEAIKITVNDISDSILLDVVMAKMTKIITFKDGF